MELIGVEGNLIEDLDFDEHSCLIEIINLVQLFEVQDSDSKVQVEEFIWNLFGDFWRGIHFLRENKVKRGSERERALWRLIKSFILRI